MSKLNNNSLYTPNPIKPNKPIVASNYQFNFDGDDNIDYFVDLESVELTGSDWALFKQNKLLRFYMFLNYYRILVNFNIFYRKCMFLRRFRPIIDYFRPKIDLKLSKNGSFNLGISAIKLLSRAFK